MKGKGKRPRGRKGTGWLTEPGTKGGIWHCGYKYKGKRYRWSAHSPLKTDANAALEDGIRQIRSGTFRVETKELNGKELAARWVATYLPMARNGKGVDLARYRVDHYFTPFFGRQHATAITKDDLRAYRGHLEGLVRGGKGPDAERHSLSDRTVRHILSDARTIFLWAADSDLIPTAPVPRGLLPAIPETVPRALTIEEQERVCAVADPWGFACRVMLASGARWSEFCRLRAEDLVEGELILRPDEDARRTRGGGRIKGRKIRRVPISDVLAREIRGHVGKLTAFEAKDNPHFVDKVVAMSGVDGFGAHRLRHSFATNYLSRGGNVKALQELMGHSTIVTTELYCRFTQDLVRQDARRVIGWQPGA